MPAFTDRNTNALTTYCRTTGTIVDRIASTSQAWLDLTHGSALHRQLNAEGLNDEAAERLIRMVRREITDTLNAATSLSQQLRAAMDAVAVLMDDVNRARRLAGKSGTSSIPFGRQS